MESALLAAEVPRCGLKYHSMVAAPLLHVLLICPAVALGLQLPSSLLPSASFTSSLRAYVDAASACAAVARDPASGEAWRCLGRLLHGKGRLEAARTALTRATELVCMCMCMCM